MPHRPDPLEASIVTAHRGLFVTFEGPEGAGKSTQVRMLAHALEERGLTTVVTREPGGTPIADTLRQLLMRRDDQGLDPIPELLMMMAARADHVARVIRPALEKGQVVVCDRFADSSVAYQGAGRGLDVSVIADLNRIATGALVPDVTFLLDIDPRIGLARARAGGSQPDRFEAETVAFHERVRQGFHALCRRETARFVMIDATLPAQEVASIVNARVMARLASATAVRNAEGA